MKSKMKSFFGHGRGLHRHGSGGAVDAGVIER
jgi:hypothetical protein